MFLELQLFPLSRVYHCLCAIRTFLPFSALLLILITIQVHLLFCHRIAQYFEILLQFFFFQSALIFHALNTLVSLVNAITPLFSSFSTSVKFDAFSIFSTALFAQL